MVEWFMEDHMPMNHFAVALHILRERAAQLLSQDESWDRDIAFELERWMATGEPNFLAIAIAGGSMVPADIPGSEATLLEVMESGIKDALYTQSLDPTTHDRLRTAINTIGAFRSADGYRIGMEPIETLNGELETLQRNPLKVLRTSFGYDEFVERLTKPTLEHRARRVRARELITLASAQSPEAESLFATLREVVKRAALDYAPNERDLLTKPATSSQIPNLDLTALVPDGLRFHLSKIGVNFHEALVAEADGTTPWDRATQDEIETRASQIYAQRPESIQLLEQLRTNRMQQIDAAFADAVELRKKAILQFLTPEMEVAEAHEETAGESMAQ